MAAHDLTWHEAWKLSGRPFDDDDLARAHRKSTNQRPWRILVAISGGVLLTMFLLVEGMWLATAGDAVARDAFGLLALLFVFPLLGAFVFLEISLINLGIKTSVQLERIASWSFAALLVPWLRWFLTQT